MILIINGSLMHDLHLAIIGLENQLLRVAFLDRTYCFAFKISRYNGMARKDCPSVFCHMRKTEGKCHFRYYVLIMLNEADKKL